MARKKYKLEESFDDWDLTAMIDIVFLLIAFFMVVAKLIDDSKIEIEVPVADQSKIPEESPSRVTVSVPANGEVYWGPQKLNNAEEVTPLVESALQAKGELLEVYIRADSRTPHKDVRAVMKAVAAGNVYSVKFAAYENQ